MDASVNLDFYGIGETDTLERDPLRYNLKPLGGMVQAKYRFGESAFWAGLGYAFATTKVDFEAPAGTPGLPDFERTSDAGGVTPSLTWDTRNNIFTPTEGTYVEGTFGVFAPLFGSDTEFRRARTLAMQFVPLSPKVFLGARADIAAAFGEPPFLS